MTPTHWSLLSVFFIIYIFFGGTIFMICEQHREIEKREAVSHLKNDIKEILFLLDYDLYPGGTNEEMIHALTVAKIGVLNRVSKSCNLGDLSPDANDISIAAVNKDFDTTKSQKSSPAILENLTWNFYNSFFFAFTVLNTIGYGHVSPSTTFGKYFLIVYALIGIPINTILLKNLGDYFSERVVQIHKTSKSDRVSEAVKIILYLVPGIFVFIIVPSWIFVVIEKWDFLDALYYTVVTLTTIGFGDYVAGCGEGNAVWMWIYQSFIILWIFTGLGYFLMILGFIAKGMTHKKVRIIINKRLHTIRITKEKASRDIDYLKRVVNELYLLKTNPVYEIKDKMTINQFNDMMNADYLSKGISQSLPHLGPTKYLDPKRNSEGFTRNTKWDGRPNNEFYAQYKSDLNEIAADRILDNSVKNDARFQELLASVANSMNMNRIQYAVEDLNDLENNILLASAPLDQQGKKDNNGESTPRRKFSPLIMDKVSEAIRKISGTSQKSCGSSTTQFRKVSRNSETRNPEDELLADPKISYNPDPSNIHKKLSRQESQEEKLRKISRESRISNASWKSGLSGLSNVSEEDQDDFYSCASGESHTGSQKMSFDKGLPLESTSPSLADFLHALDSVHSKLQLGKKSSIDNENPFAEKSKNPLCRKTSGESGQDSAKISFAKPRISTANSRKKNTFRSRKINIYQRDFSLEDNELLQDGSVKKDS